MEKMTFKYKKISSFLCIVFFIVFSILLLLTIYFFKDTTYPKNIVKIILLFVLGLGVVLSICTFVETMFTKTIVDENSLIRVRPIIKNQEIKIEDISKIEICNREGFPPFRIVIYDKNNNAKVSFFDGGQVARDENFLNFMKEKNVTIENKF